MSHDRDTEPGSILEILDNLLDAMTALQSRQDENDSAPHELIHMAHVDVQDIIDQLNANPDALCFDAAAQLNTISTWLAAYLRDYQDVTRNLTALIDAAAATISNLDTSANDDDSL